MFMTNETHLPNLLICIHIIIYFLGGYKPVALQEFVLVEGHPPQRGRRHPCQIYAPKYN